MTRIDLQLAMATLMLYSAVSKAQPSVAEPPVVEPAPAERPFHIQTVTGTVVARLPFEPGWRKVKAGSNLAAGTLLQVESKSQIGFDYPKPGTQHGKNERATISISSPIVARFDRNLLRKVKVDSQFIEPAEENTALTKPSNRPMVGRLREAWQKFIATVRSDKDSDSAANDLEEKRKTGKIDILRPTPDGLIATGNPTSGVRIVWRSIGIPATSYNLKVWPVDAAEPAEPTAQTQDTEFLVKPPRFGRYRVSVWTPSGGWQSPVTTFELVPEGVAGTDLNNSETKSSSRTNDLALIFPPDHFTVSDGALPYYLDCVWLDHRGTKGLTRYEVIVRDHTDRVRARVSTWQHNARVFLPIRGAYSWQVRATQPGATPLARSYRTSPKRFFTLEQTKVADRSGNELARRLEAMLAMPGKNVLMLEQGL